MDDDHLLVVGERTLCLYNMNKDVVTDTRSLDFKTMVVSRYDYKPALFDDVGRMHVVRAFNKLETEQMPFREQVTAFGSSKGSGQRVYGTSEGIIYVLDGDGTLHRLVGHRSRISRVRMVKTILYSTSYDGTIKLWATSNEKIEPMTLYEGNKWILDFSFDAKKNYVWTGDVHGNLAQVGVATKMMSQQLREQLKRDLTEEEWTYYIGRNIPYEKFKK